MGRPLGVSGWWIKEPPISRKQVLEKLGLQLPMPPPSLFSCFLLSKQLQKIGKQRKEIIEGKEREGEDSSPNKSSISNAAWQEQGAEDFTA